MMLAESCEWWTTGGWDHTNRRGKCLWNLHRAGNTFRRTGALSDLDVGVRHSRAGGIQIATLESSLRGNDKQTLFFVLTEQ